jgi:hypothetical protein
MPQIPDSVESIVADEMYRCWPKRAECRISTQIAELLWQCWG